MSVRDNGSGRYEASIQIDGRRHYKTFDTKTEANKWKSQMRAAGSAVVAPADQRTRLDKWLVTWLDMRRPKLEASTAAWYEQAIRLHITPALGRYQLGQLHPEHIQTWVNDTVEEKGTSTATRAFAVLNASLNAAVRMRKLTTNPASMIESKPSHDAGEKTFLTPDELRAVVGKMPDQWSADVVMALAFTGARVGELMSVTPADVNLLKWEVTLPTFKRRKKGLTRTIPIAEPVREVFARRLAQVGPSGLVFVKPTWAAWHDSEFGANYWHAAVEEAGVGRHVRPHDLRHTCASWLIASGHNPVQVCRWMGHSTPSQTLDTYAHLFPDDFGDMAGSMAATWEAEGPTRLRKVEG